LGSSATDLSQDGQTEGGPNTPDDPNGLDDDFEDKAVQCFRFFVLFILVSAMAAAGVCTYVFISKDQEDDFAMEVSGTHTTKHRLLPAVSFVFRNGIIPHHTLIDSCLFLYVRWYIPQFELVAEAIVKGSDATVHAIMNDINCLASSLTAIAGPDIKWPFFTTDSFSVIGSNFRLATAALFVALVPKVKTFQVPLEDWEVYSVNNQGWIQEGLMFDSKITDSTPVVVQPEDVQEIPTEVYRRIGSNYTDTVPVTGSGIFGPIWQMSPAPPHTWMPLQ
jgi:hypothetical protein